MLMILSVSAQTGSTINVRGTVKDVAGEPIIGASILLQGTTSGVVTDYDGNFSIQAPGNGTLVISYVGYITQTIAIQNRNSIEVILQEDMELLDEVVVIGYATGSTRTISGAVEKVGREDMNAGVIVNPLDALKGKVAGVNIQKTGGDPTAGSAIRIRGTTSLSGGNDPLVVIDGVFGDLALLNALSPSDIESFTILKDASETAQYGSRGASGVIVVTTQKGKAGTKSINYDGTFGVEDVYKTINMLNADGYRAAVESMGYANALDKGANTNFMQEMLQTGYTQNHRISFGGGTAETNFRASLGVIDQKGIIKNNSMRNYTAKIDGSQLYFDNKLKLDLGMFGSKRESRYVNDYQKTFYSAASFNPTFPNTQNDDGTWPEDPNANEVDNPLGRLTISDKEDNAYLSTNGRLTWAINDNLNLSAFGSYTYNAKENMNYIPTNIKQGVREGRGKAYRGMNKSNILMGNISLNYKKMFQNSRLDALALIEGQNYNYTGFGANARGFDTNFFGYDNLAAGAVVKYGDVSSYKNGYSLNSFLGRVNYMYANRYIATVNMRFDGSSKLGENNKWGFFPSASLAWVMSEESFLKDINEINEIKWRVGYGRTGNQDAISAYNSLLLMGPSGLTSVNGVPTVTYGYNRNANPDLRWETKDMFDVGMDASFFDRKLTATIDYYYSRTKDLLYNYDVPVPPFVHPKLLANLGEMENSGLEVSLGITPLRTEDMELTVSGNMAFQKNKLLSLSGTYMGQELNAAEYMQLARINGAGFQGGNTYVTYQVVGQPLGVFYLPKSNGIINDGLGSYSYNILNLDEDPAINLNNGADRYFAGQAMPKVIMGTNISFRYKAFDIQTQMNGAFGHKIYNGTSLSYMNMNVFPTYNVLPDAPEKKIFDSTVTDYWLEKGDYLHIAYVTLGYNFNVEKMKNWVNSIRLTASVNNLHTFTNYSGLSPMINSTTVNEELGLDDKRFYPLSRTYSLGLSINF
ncbi:SusC/RagA family TonB-linked outer membrane protein [Petrimonas sulfuriphila]|nr:SusC/RagA family TonB-linked outer membrane protein [Porphyromonadaceae bacterium]HBF95354.1 SusC/RagA family TonB-linked outer membrane protein [Porphyromonadaceae bacterium]HBK94027.1 SusC/RagA family TonB-linked outer membrane protein [Porphyromonadaceae bacterium]HBQ56524.1 SusC/RagA family TonB-linked outer membrane protein [Porphyromonadaceae bacterium]HBU45821.1 SusC/RagA family TonB-linked outer membrane protein [Porphyromonadaceae bacterium]